MRASLALTGNHVYGQGEDPDIKYEGDDRVPSHNSANVRRCTVPEAPQLCRNYTALLTVGSRTVGAIGRILTKEKTIVTAEAKLYDDKTVRWRTARLQL